MLQLRRWLILMVAVMGCTSPVTPEVQVVAMPELELAAPVVNLPIELRQSNWVSNEAETRGQGSCVFASMVSHAQWQNRPDIAAYIRKNFSGGETETGLIAKLDAMKAHFPDLDYSYTRRADPRFLDWCDERRCGCILWWKPYHCCKFTGWVDRQGTQYASILDNNHTEQLELTESEQFIRLWAGYGGFGLALLFPPGPNVPYVSYVMQ